MDAEPGEMLAQQLIEAAGIVDVAEGREDVGTLVLGHIKKPFKWIASAHTGSAEAEQGIKNAAENQRRGRR